MAFSVEEFKAQLRGGGARSTHFQVQINSLLNLVGGAAQKLSYMCKAASLPPSNQGSIRMKYFGRDIVIQGDRTFPEWTITVINDEDFLVRSAFEAWMGRMNGHETNLNKFGSPDPALYKADAQIFQYGKTGNLLRSYRFTGLFPTALGEITTAWDANDQVEEFTVTLQYDYWLLDPVAATPGAVAEVI